MGLQVESGSMEANASVNNQDCLCSKELYTLLSNHWFLMEADNNKKEITSRLFTLSFIHSFHQIIKEIELKCQLVFVDAMWRVSFWYQFFMFIYPDHWPKPRPRFGWSRANWFTFAFLFTAYLSHQQATQRTIPYKRVVSTVVKASDR